ADVSVQPTPDLVKHDAVSRRIDVTLSVHGRDRTAVLNDVKQRLQGISFPLEFHAEVLGDYAAQQAVQARMLGFWVAAMIAICLLLQTAFDSWRLAMLAFLTLPLALVGGVFAVLATGRVISLGSLVGFLAVLAIALRNGIVLINHYQQLERREGEPFGP